MKKLLIIVPKDSLLNNYLMKTFRVYARLSEIEGMVYYNYIGQSNPMDTINFLAAIFMLSDFSINCEHGDYTFRVRP